MTDHNAREAGVEVVSHVEDHEVDPAGATAETETLCVHQDEILALDEEIVAIATVGVVIVENHEEEVNPAHAHARENVRRAVIENDLEVLLYEMERLLKPKRRGKHRRLRSEKVRLVLI